MNTLSAQPRARAARSHGAAWFSGLRPAPPRGGGGGIADVHGLDAEGGAAGEKHPMERKITASVSAFAVMAFVISQWPSSVGKRWLEPYAKKRGWIEVG